MVCYACRRRAVEQCPRCGRQYCNAHGRDLCRECASPLSALPAHLTYRAVLLSSLLLAVVGVAYLQVWPEAPAAASRPFLMSVQEDGPGADAPRPLTIAPGLFPSPAATPAATPTPSPTAAPTPTPAPAPLTYTIVAGDTLIGIAVRFGTTSDAIMAANGMTNPNALLRLGQELVIPR